MTCFRLPVDRLAKLAIVLRLRGRFARSWPARVSCRRPWVLLRRMFSVFTAVTVPRLRTGVTALGVRSAGMPLGGQRRCQQEIKMSTFQDSKMSPGG